MSINTRIEHIVCLMMENQSFDRILGFVDGVGTLDGTQYALNSSGEKIYVRKGADPISIAEIMTEKFGAEEQNGLFYYNNAKTLVMYCNGMWCGQSPNNIKSLLKYGYPADKIKWFRGGMQTWEILGFNTVK